MNQKYENFFNTWSKIVARSWVDENFKEELMQNTERVLKSEGIYIPPGVKVQVHENNQNTYNVVLPFHREDLTEQELRNIAGGNSNTQTLS